MRNLVFLMALLLSQPALAFSLFQPNVDAVKKLLNDPYSAKFEDVTTVPNEATCGTVNYKNQYGAYGGPKEFAIVDGSGYVEGTPEADEMIIVYCIHGKDCKDDDCMTKVIDERKAELQKEIDERRKAEYAGVIDQMRAAAAQVCANHMLNDNHVKLAACSKEYEPCRKTRDVEQEFQCMSEIVRKYK